jgi:hypothetical protein
MDKAILEKIDQQVIAQFPYLTGISPQVKEVRAGLFELKYTGSVLTANGQTLPVIVKVIADDQGKIQKLVTSR